MQARERVLTALSHREPDRIPINFAGTLCTSIVESVPNGMTYTKLCRYLGINDFIEPVISDALNVVCNVDEKLQRRMGNDFKCVFPRIPPAIIESDGTKTSLALGGLRIKRMGYYDEYFDFPARDWTGNEDIETYPFWPDPNNPFLWEGLRQETQDIRKNTPYALVLDSEFSCFPFNNYAFLRGFENWFIDMKINPNFYFALCDKLLEIGTEANANLLKEIGDLVDIVVVYDDLGTQTAPFFSISDYRTFIKPYNRAVIANIKKYSPQARILMHCCGSIFPLIPELIEIGVEILHPVQPAAKDMEPSRIKQEFGKDITLMTGLDIQNDLPHLDPASIRDKVKFMIDSYAPGGGFIFAPTHNIEPDTKPENIVAAFDTALEYGWY